MRALASCRALALGIAALQFVAVARSVHAQAGAPAAGEVAGVVLAERSRLPIAGALVGVEGDSVRAAADADGRFRLRGLGGASVTLVVHRIGYGELRRTVRVGDVSVRILLNEVAVPLQEIVVTGTPDAALRQALGNAVATLDVSEAAARGGVPSLHQVVTGRVPGVLVRPSSGALGTGARVVLRGAPSFTLGNEPLLFVDGVRAANAPATGPPLQGFGSSAISRMDDLAVGDVQSIEIIRGPAAATLYGTEASAGVIDVITKQGALGPPRWSFDARAGTVYLRDPASRFPTNYQRTPSGDVISVDLVDREAARGTPIFTRGHESSYHLSVGGGSDQLRYYVAGGYGEGEGVERFNEIRRANARVNVTLAPSERLTIAASVGYGGGPTRVGPEGGFGGRVWTTALADPRKLPGGGGDTTRRGFHAALPEEYDLEADYGAKGEQDIDRLVAGLRLAHHTLEWLDQRLVVGVDRVVEVNTIFVPRIDALIATPPFPNQPQGYKEISSRHVDYGTVDYSAVATFPLGAALRSATSLGAQYYRAAADSVFSSGVGFPTEGLSSINSTTGLRRSEEGAVENATLGVYLQEQLASLDRRFLTVALRVDDNSAFGSSFDAVYYPKASVSWVVSREPFFHLPGVSTLRLRAAYGEAGKQPLAFAATRTYSAVAGPGDAPAVTPQRVGNPDLGPERGRELELGADLGLLHERAGVELTLYAERTSGGILEREVAPSGGFPGTQLFNAGELRNSGLEAMARLSVLRREPIAWDVTFTLGANRSEVTSLGGPDFVTAGTYLRHQVGYPAGSWFEKRVVSAQMSATGFVSDVKCDDGRGGAMPCAGADGRYGTADDAPAVYLGRSVPSRVGAVANEVGLLHRRLRLYALVDFATGQRALDGNTLARCTMFGGRCRENFFPTEFDPRRVAAVQSNRNLVDFVIEDASFAKLREVSVVWSLPERWTSALHARHADLSLAGRELHTWTHYRGTDPEARWLGGSFGGDYGGWEQAMIPPLTHWTLGVGLEL